MKKKKLVADIDFNFALWAMVSSQKEYKIAWQLNHKLNINLVKSNDELFEFLDEVKLYISNYCYQTEHQVVRLIVNRSVDESSAHKRHLIPELKQFDYLLCWEGAENYGSSLEQIRDLIRNIPGIQLVQLVDLEPIKSKENLIF